MMTSAQIAFTPLLLGETHLRNRIGLAPLNTGMIDGSGLPTEDFEQFHSLYAQSGLGIVFIGGVAVSASARARACSFALDSQAKVDRLSRTIGKVLSFGALPILQLMHAGRQSSLDGPLYAASALPGAISPRVPLPLDRDQIEMIVEDFGGTAARARQAGIRMIEVHAAHGYLLSDFLSPSLNVRTDCFGGTSENRFHLLKKIMDRVLQISGVSVGVRLNGRENIKGGLTEEDLMDLVDRTQSAGASYVSVSAGVYNLTDIIMPDRSDGEVVFRRLGQIAKARARIPVMLAGNITTVQSANEVITNEVADIALMGRALLANPDILEQHEAGILRPDPCCTMKRVCKYNGRRLPQISCPHNQLLMSQLILRLRMEGRMPSN